MLRATLTKWGYDVVEATNGEEAWAHFTGPDPAPLAIVDWMMPGLSGPDLCSLLKGCKQKRTPVQFILLTSRSDWQDVVSGLEAGADGFRQP